MQLAYSNWEPRVIPYVRGVLHEKDLDGPKKVSFINMWSTRHYSSSIRSLYYTRFSMLCDFIMAWAKCRIRIVVEYII